MQQFAPHRWLLGPMSKATAIGRFRLLTYLGHGVYDSMIAYHLHDNEGWKMAEISLLLSANALMGIIIGPSWSVLADTKKMHKQILMLAMFGMSTCILLQAFSPPKIIFWIVMVLMYIFGAAVNPITTGLTASLAETTGEYTKLQSFGPLGYGAGALLIGFLSQFTGLGIIFYVFTLILLGCVSVLRWFPIEAEKGTSSVWSIQKMKPLFNQKMSGFWIAVFLVTGPLQSFLSIFGLLFQSAGGHAQDIGYATMFGYAVQWAALRYKGQWFDRWTLSVQQWITYGVVFIMGVRWFAMFIYPSMFTFWFAFACQGAGIAFLISSFELQMKTIAGHNLTTSGIGILYSVISLAMFGSTLLSSLATKITGNVLTTALLFGVVTLIGLLVMSSTHLQQKKKQVTVLEQQTEPEVLATTLKQRKTNTSALLFGIITAVGLLVLIGTQVKKKRSS